MSVSLTRQRFNWQHQKYTPSGIWQSLCLLFQTEHSVLCVLDESFITELCSSQPLTRLKPGCQTSAEFSKGSLSFCDSDFAWNSSLSQCCPAFDTFHFCQMIEPSGQHLVLRSHAKEAMPLSGKTLVPTGHIENIDSDVIHPPTKQDDSYWCCLSMILPAGHWARVPSCPRRSHKAGLISYQILLVHRSHLYAHPSVPPSPAPQSKVVTAEGKQLYNSQRTMEYTTTSTLSSGRVINILFLLVVRESINQQIQKEIF